MKTLSAFKAQAMPRQPNIESAHLLLEVPIPELPSLEDARLTYQQQARQIAELLISTLPGGTVDALTAELLTHKASLLRIPHLLSDYQEQESRVPR